MKIKIAGLILISFFLFTGASPWEGAASVSPEGELPSRGRYVATNSYPRNTVVDIVNIETNKSTRAIVVSGLDSPGLLAIVSKETADLIGMRVGSVSRIRMTQPSEPIAYLRFRDEAASSDYDSGNTITEWAREEEESTKEIETTAPPARTAPAVVQGAPPYFLEPEWSSGSRKDIIDLPEKTEELAWEEKEVVEVIEEIEEIAEIEEMEEIEEIEEVIAEETPEEIEEVIVEETPEEIEEVIAEETPEEIEEVIAEETPEEIEEVIAEEIFEEPEEEIADLLDYDFDDTIFDEEELALEEEEFEPIIEYTLVETEEKPPENGIYGIDLDSIIPGVTVIEYEDETEIVSAPETETEIETSYLAPDYSTTEETFLAQRVKGLQRGRYYVQIAAIDAPELVNSIISEIYIKEFEPIVYKDGDRWYRILLGGPHGLNQGESAAVLQRFKSIGYKDAFVRLEK